MIFWSCDSEIFRSENLAEKRVVYTLKMHYRFPQKGDKEWSDRFRNVGRMEMCAFLCAFNCNIAYWTIIGETASELDIRV